MAQIRDTKTKENNNATAYKCTSKTETRKHKMFTIKTMECLRKQKKTIQNSHRKNRSSRAKARTIGVYSTYATMCAFAEKPRVERVYKQVKLFNSWRCLLPLLLTLVVYESSIDKAYAMANNAHATTTATRYSQPLIVENNNDNSGGGGSGSADSAGGFHPIIPKDINLEYISQNVFTKAGQYHVFEPVESDLRATTTMAQGSAYNIDDEKRASTGSVKEKVLTLQTKRKTALNEKQAEQQTTTTMNEKQTMQQIVAKTNDTSNIRRTPEQHSDVVKSKQLLPDIKRDTKTTIKPPIVNEMKGLEELLTDYVNNFFNNAQYQPNPELITALQQNYTVGKQQKRRASAASTQVRPVREVFTKRAASGELSLNIPRALETGRLFFFTGLKKIMWPVYMGLQILKSLLFALFLPTLIGSFGKLLGKGITSGSAPLFIRPMDEPQDLDFKDNNFNFDDDSNKFTLMDDNGGSVKDTNTAGYAYNQAEASQTHNQYAYNAASINQQALSRYGMNERQQLMQDSYLSALQSLGAASFKNSNGLSGSSSGGGGLAGLTSPMRQKPAAPANINTFQQFQKVPASSLLLSNYDPFYSPLLSRLDSVFAQLKLNSDDETCREKLICLMYANPAKYAPYSNLVSAQLSRELNELRKPTSDNPDILRFFKYMRAAKDGQDGIDCEKSFEKCKEFKDFENPAMVSTYHDINKLVQARKLT